MRRRLRRVLPRVDKTGLTVVGIAPGRDCLDCEKDEDEYGQLHSRTRPNQSVKIFGPPVANAVSNLDYFTKELSASSVHRGRGDPLIRFSNQDIFAQELDKEKPVPADDSRTRARRNNRNDQAAKCRRGQSEVWRILVLFALSAQNCSLFLIQIFSRQWTA